MAPASEAVGGSERHIPVLLPEVLAALAPLEGAVVLDGTFGAGGYSQAILDAGAARVIGIDRDQAAIAAGQAMVAAAAGRLDLVEGPFSELDALAGSVGVDRVDAVVLDIGVSSMQLDQAERGFSFLRDGPLDMRMSASGETAADLVNGLDEHSLAEIFYVYGEERASRRVAKAIVARRAEAPIGRTSELAAIVANCLPKPKPGQIHPATRSFQALRIAVNDELGQLVKALAAAERLLGAGGRLAVVTFHSLEDRIVKRYFQIAGGREAQGSRHMPAAEPAAPRYSEVAKPVAPGEGELARNPRARSAKLRRAIRTGAPAQMIEPGLLGLPRLSGQRYARGRR